MLAKNAEGEQWQGHIVVALQQGKQAVSTVAVPHTVAYHVLTSIQNCKIKPLRDGKGRLKTRTIVRVLAHRGNETALKHALYRHALLTSY